MPEKWKPDEAIKRAIVFYESFKPISAGLLEDTRVAVNKLREMLREIDLKKEDSNHKPVYTLNTVTATIKQIPSLVKDLDEAERTLAQEIAQSNKVRGAAEKHIFVAILRQRCCGQFRCFCQTGAAGKHICKAGILQALELAFIIQPQRAYIAAASYFSLWNRHMITIIESHTGSFEFDGTAVAEVDCCV